MFYTYCLRSLKTNKFYIGFTNDLKRRFIEHNKKQGGKFTSKNGPWKLIFYEAHQNKADAVIMEQFYKSGYGRGVLKQKLTNYLDSEVV